MHTQWGCDDDNYDGDAAVIAAVPDGVNHINDNDTVWWRWQLNREIQLSLQQIKSMDGNVDSNELMIMILMSKVDEHNDDTINLLCYLFAIP